MAPATGDLVRTDVHTAWERELEGGDARDYESFVQSAAGAHYTQTAAWAKIAVAGRPRVARFFLARSAGRVIGAAIVLRPRALGPLLTPVAIIERGPVCADPADLAKVLPALVRAARRRGVARLVVMPYWAGARAAEAEVALAGAGFRDVQQLDGAHVSTLRLEVAGKDDAALLAGSDRKKLRYELKNAERAGATVRRASMTEMATLAHLDAQLADSQGKAKRKNAWFAAVAAYITADEARGALFICEHEGAPVSAVLALRHAGVAVYSAGASILDARPFSKMALPLLAAARWARDAGCDVLDLGGIPMEGDADPKRIAIAQFKRDFSKAPVRLVREHARWF
jgi:lipid II:glycine glycyltransferase (peptidoglycan interpeptide bridge formation enzyme)